MPIPTRCSCGAQFAAPDKLAGRRVKCPRCSEPVQVPSAAGEDSGARGGVSSVSAIGIKCACGKSLKVPAKLAGKTVKCPGCGSALPVPRPVRTPATAGAASESSADDGVAGLLDEADLNLSKTGRRCPECRSDLELDDVICVNCGYNTETGRRIKVRKVEKRDLVGGVDLNDLKQSPQQAELSPPVQSLIKLLGQAAVLALLMAVLILAYLGYQRMQANPNAGTDAIITLLTGSGAFILGGFGLLVTVPCLVASKLVEKGHPAGRILSIVMGFVSLLGFPLLTLLGVLILKTALSPEVARHCR